MAASNEAASNETGPASEPAGTGPLKLRRNLSVWEAIGISLALMAPSMAASINPQGTATTVGRAVPIAFALAFVGVLLVAYTFVRLTQRFHHSGSVYGFVGATLGPRAGVISGWALTGTYTFYAVVTSMAGGRFAANFLNAIGVWKNPPPSASAKRSTASVASRCASSSQRGSPVATCSSPSRAITSSSGADGGRSATIGRTLVRRK